MTGEVLNAFDLKGSDLGYEGHSALLGKIRGDGVPDPTVRRGIHSIDGAAGWHNDSRPPLGDASVRQPAEGQMQM